MAAIPVVYSKHDITAQIRQRKWVKETDVIVACNRLSAIAFQDVIELYLRLSGIRTCEWRETQGATRQWQPVWRASYHLLRDLVAWPLVYTAARREIASLRRTMLQAPLPAEPRALFLRTDHWFDIQSGGSVGHVTGVIHALRSLGYLTHVVSTDCLAGIEHDQCFHLCTPVYSLGRNLPELSELRYNEQLFSFITRQWVRWRPAFLYHRYSLGNYTGVKLKATYGVPYVCEYNGSFVWVARHWSGHRLFHERLMNDIELLNLDAADVVVVVSQALKEGLVARGIDPAKILVNPNGVNPDQYSPAIDGNPVRARYGLGGKTVIGFIGTFGPWHGAEVLAEAFGRLLQENPTYREKVRLLMIGDGVRMPQVKERLAHYKVADYAVLTGLIPQTEGPAHLAACDILASPHVPNPDGTPFFGSPTKLFEYMAMGKGIVASDLEQIGQVLAHGRTAWLVRPGDPAALGVGLQQLVEDAELRQRLGEHARAEVVAKYTWRAHTERIIEMLKARIDHVPA